MLVLLCRHESGPGDELAKILVVSDIHYEQGNFHGIDESRSFNWILNILIETSSTDLVGFGDWGFAWSLQEWEEIRNMLTIGRVRYIIALKRQERQQNNFITMPVFVISTYPER
jgi:hypothetical protein